MNGSLRLANKAKMAPGGNVSEFSYVAPSILDLLPAWAIDARSGAEDLVGAVDAVPMTGTLLDPTDGAVQFVTLSTNEGGDGINSTGSYLWTADSVANSVTGDIDIRALSRSIDDATNNGAVPQNVKVAKYQGDVINSFDYMMSALVAGDAHLAFGNNAVDVTGDIDVYDYTALRVTRVAASGLVTAYVEDDADFDVATDDGRNWRLLGSATGLTGAVPNTAGMILTYMVGKGVGGWCQVYDGIDGTLVVDMDIVRDATAGLSSGDTFTADTGETWTLNEFCATFGVDRKAWAVGSPGDSVSGPFAVPDAAALDIGTGDFTAAIVYEPATLASGAADFRTLFFKANPATIGSAGPGWGFIDYSPLGGVGFAFNDGAGLHFAAASWAAGTRHLIVATGDRDGNLNLYVNDMTTPAATADISAATGSLANAIDVSCGGPDPSLLGAAAVWDRVLTAGELAQLSTLMGA